MKLVKLQCMEENPLTGRMGSQDTDLPLIYDILGGGLDEFFNIDATGEARTRRHQALLPQDQARHLRQQRLQDNRQHSQQQEQPSRQHQQQQLETGMQDVGFQRQESASCSRQNSDGTSAGSHGNQNPYDQLVQLQAQLEAVQKLVGSTLQTLQQQKEEASITPCPDVQDMQKLLVHMQDLLQQSRHQQGRQHLGVAPTLKKEIQSEPVTDEACTVQSSIACMPQIPLEQQLPGVPAISSHVPAPEQQAKAQRATTAREPAGKRPKAKNAVAELERQLEAKQAEADALLQKNLALKRRQRMLGHFIKVREDQMNRLTIMQSTTRLAQTFAHTANSSSSFIKSFTVERMCTMDQAGSNAMFEQFVQEVSRLLALSDAAGHQGMTLGSANAASVCVMSELQDLITGIMEVDRYMMFLNPAFHNIRYTDAPQTAEVPSGHWQQCVLAAALREDQIEDIRVLHDIHRHMTSRVYKERHHLASQLTQLLGSRPRQTTSNSQDVLDRHRSVQLNDQLHRNLLQERCILFLTAEVLNSHVLDIAQMANLTVATYPHKPDDIAIINEVIRMYQTAA